MRATILAACGVGLGLISVAVYIFSLPAGHATIGDVRGIAGLCGLLIGSGIALIGLSIALNVLGSDE